MLDPSDRGKTYGEFTRNVLFALLLLGRFDEMEAVCAETLSASEDPALLAHATYAKAVLNARLYDPARRDYDAARAWVEKSLAFTERLPPSATRAVNIAFLWNTMALVEMRQGRPAAALRLLSDAIDYMAREAPDRYEAESAILLHNRARLHVVLEQADRAIDDLTTLLRQQPSDTEAYFDRGVLHQRAGRHEAALRDYDAAIKWSPPYDEPHFNRAQMLVALGRKTEALADYDYVLVLEPDHAEALINRACLLYERRNFAAARADADRALRRSPGNARLLCLCGLIEMTDAHFDQAHRSFTRSIEADPSLPDAWANRATVLFKRGDLDGALRDLTQAASLREDSEILYNLGRVLEAQGRWQEAVDDYARALEVARGDVRHILRHRSLCDRAIGRAIGRADSA
jgi:tetratricopeptide (TPR) repeat protein